MAKVMEKGDLLVVVEAKNIGFLKGLKDTIDTELGGMETLATQAVEDAVKAVPVGCNIKDIRVQAFGGVNDNVLATVIAKRRS